MKGIYWGGNLEQLKYMVEKKMVSHDDIKFFAGYSGWDPNQLKQELKHHTWLLYECSKRLAFTEDPQQLWGTVLKTMGSDYAIMANFPVDPSLN
jgi:putative transcriptional regulator